MAAVSLCPVKKLDLNLIYQAQIYCTQILEPISNILGQLILSSGHVPEDLWASAAGEKDPLRFWPVPLQPADGEMFRTSQVGELPYPRINSQDMEGTKRMKNLLKPCKRPTMSAVLHTVHEFPFLVSVGRLQYNVTSSCGLQRWLWRIDVVENTPNNSSTPRSASRHSRIWPCRGQKQASRMENHNDNNFTSDRKTFPLWIAEISVTNICFLFLNAKNAHSEKPSGTSRALSSKDHT